MPLVLAFLGALLLPGFALAQSSQSNLTPVQRCEQNHQSCVRACTGVDSQTCMTNCAAVRAHCIQNPSTATQPRR
jgi:hypothetical protein